LNSRQKGFETLVWPEESSIIYCAKSRDRGSDTCRSRSSRRAAVIITCQTSEVEAFSGITKRLSVSFEAFFLGFKACLFSLSTPTPRIISVYL
jgi:hypothetical protein